MPELPEGVTQEQVDAAIETLRAFEDLPYKPLDLFLAIGATTTMAAVEFVPFVEDRDNGLMVVVTQRPEDDSHWAGEWHTPGRTILPTDPYGFDVVLDRILKRELPGAKIERGPFDFGAEHRSRAENPRGPELTARYWGVMEAPVDVGRTVPVDAVPEPYIEHHRRLLSDAIESYLDHK